MLAAIFRKSTLLVHYNLQILLIIRIIMDVYRNFPGFKMPRKSADKRLYTIYLPTRPLTPLTEALRCSLQLQN